MGERVKPLAATFAANAKRSGLAPISTASVTATTVIRLPLGMLPGPMAQRMPVTRKSRIGTRYVRLPARPIAFLQIYSSVPLTCARENKKDTPQRFKNRDASKPARISLPDIPDNVPRMNAPPMARIPMLHLRQNAMATITARNNTENNAIFDVMTISPYFFSIRL